MSGDAPSKYLLRLKNHAGVSDEEFDSILHSHVVSPEYMYSDDFYGFFADRKERILQKIEVAMGKKIARDQEEQEEGVFVDSGGERSDIEDFDPLQ